MNSLSVFRIHYLFGELAMNLLGVLWLTIDFREITMNSLFSRKFTMNSVSSPWIHYLLRLPWIHYLFCELKMNSLSFSRIHYLFCDSTMISFFVPRIRYIFNENAMNSLFPLLHYEYTICFANSLSISRIHFFFGKFTVNLLSFLQFILNFHEFTIYWTNSLWMLYQFT